MEKGNHSHDNDNEDNYSECNTRQDNEDNHIKVNDNKTNGNY